MPAMSKPKSSWDQVADQLVSGYWDWANEPERAFKLGAERSLRYDFSALDADEKFLATSAMAAWAAATGITFVDINRQSGNGSAQIYFDNTDDGAYASSEYANGNITSSYVNINSDWDVVPKSLNSYWFYTYMHEIGHALGLGHAGNYNFDATWSDDKSFKYDSWHASVMSYFTQDENPNVTADYAYLATIRPADVIAMQRLYGPGLKTQLGDTVYGAQGNANGTLGKLLSVMLGDGPTTERYDLGYQMSFTLIDSGGQDTIDFSTLDGDQEINLAPLRSSSIEGAKGFLTIARGTRIESAKSGSGDDRLVGTNRGDRLDGGAGNDTLLGRGGSDTLMGGAGDDLFHGGAGKDWLSLKGNASTRGIIDLRKEVQHFGQGTDRLISIENLKGGQLNDKFYGSSKANRLEGNSGNDALKGRGGDDTLKGGSGIDKLVGNAGDDLLVGGRGSDRLNGGAGDDTLVGGVGNDHFVFGRGADVLRDFTLGRDDIAFSSKLWGGPNINPTEVVARFAHVAGDDLIFDFGRGNTLLLRDVTDITAIANDIFVY